MSRSAPTGMGPSVMLFFSFKAVFSQTYKIDLFTTQSAWKERALWIGLVAKLPDSDWEPLQFVAKKIPGF